MHLTCCANQGKQFLQYTVNRDETWVKHVTPETKEASMMWKHPSPPLAKKFKAMPLVRKRKATVFLYYEIVHVMDFTECADTV
jgi:hypothetical protein